MARTKPNSADYTDMTNQVTSATVDAENTSPQDYQCRWSDWYGYYVGINPLGGLIDKKALWTIGKGFKADEPTKKQLNRIRGCGKDTFNTIMHNGVKTYTIGGDFLAEKITNSRNGLLNLKPLNPGSFKIRANSKGIIKKYEQMEALNIDKPETISKRGVVQSFKADEIFHLPYNRTADEIHGVGVVEKLEEHLLQFKEATDDMRVVFHRYVKPLIISAVDTDDEDEIAAYKQKLDKAVENGENMVVPKGVLDNMDRMSIPQYSTLDPLPWIKWLEKQFLISEGVPEVILGVGEGATEASSKILYLSWQQIVEWNQLFLEENIKAQLGLDVEFNFPANIAPELEQDAKKRRKENNMGNPAGHDD